jgi:hypothetical protein
LLTQVRSFFADKFLDDLCGAVASLGVIES